MSEDWGGDEDEDEDPPVVEEEEADACEAPEAVVDEAALTWLEEAQQPEPQLEAEGAGAAAEYALSAEAEAAAVVVSPSREQELRRLAARAAEAEVGDTTEEEVGVCGEEAAASAARRSWLGGMLSATKRLVFGTDKVGGLARARERESQGESV
jgi:hypothetical protein